MKAGGSAGTAAERRRPDKRDVAETAAESCWLSVARLTKGTSGAIGASSSSAAFPLRDSLSVSVVFDFFASLWSVSPSVTQIVRVCSGG